MRKETLSEDIADVTVEIIKTPFKIVGKTFDWMTGWM